MSNHHGYHSNERLSIINYADMVRERQRREHAQDHALPDGGACLVGVVVGAGLVLLGFGICLALVFAGLIR